MGKFLNNLKVLLTAIVLAHASYSAANTTSDISDRDLAIIIPKDYVHSLPAFESTNRWGLLPKKAFFDIANSFIDTAVKTAITDENSIDEWGIVSARVEPCAPLFPHIRTKSTLCWPELRIVLQPILKRKIHAQGSLQEHFADDRTVHVLYTVSPYSFLPSEKAAEADRFISTLKAGKPLSDEEFVLFSSLRNEVAKGFLEETLQLRSTNTQSSDYAGFDMRPEFYNEFSASSFVTKFTNFLKRHAFFSRLHTATAFSLPEGRTPSHTDTWVFKKYTPTKEGGFSEVDITLHHRNGRIMFNIGKTETASMQKDDEVFYSDTLTDRQKMMLSHHVVLNRSKDAELLKNIADSNIFLVEHTSCASCHKLIDRAPANFHALSYFINEAAPTVSPRVKIDVKHAKEWILKEIK